MKEYSRKSYGLNHIALTIRDVEEIDNFYNKLLGCNLEKKFKINSELSFQIFNIKRETEVFLVRKENLFFELFLYPETVKLAYSHVCINVPEREKLVRLAGKENYKVKRIARDIHDLLFISDKNNNIFELKET